MKLLSRVVWSEGMYLGPHHFQVQSRYFEDSIQFATSSLWFSAYGLAGVDLDAHALQNGTVSLIHARGIFPDGLPFNMPESDELPRAARHRRSISAHPRRHRGHAGDSAAQAQRLQLRPGIERRRMAATPRAIWPNRACCTTKIPAPTSAR